MLFYLTSSTGLSSSLVDPVPSLEVAIKDADVILSRLSSFFFVRSSNSFLKLVLRLPSSTPVRPSLSSSLVDPIWALEAYSRYATVLPRHSSVSLSDSSSRYRNISISSILPFRRIFSLLATLLAVSWCITPRTSSLDSHLTAIRYSSLRALTQG